MPPADLDSISKNMPSACPFVDDTNSEYEINNNLYPHLTNYHHDIGYYSQILAGHVKVNSYRADGASGGLVKWFLVQAMNQGIVDKVLQVRQTTNPDSLFEYYIADSPQQVRAGAKSAYYPTNFAHVIREVLSDKSSSTYAFVGLPCFCHSLRLLQEEFPTLKTKIPVVVAIFCGHLKSKKYLDLMSLQAGKPDLTDEIVYADFRYKSDGDLNASRYSFFAETSTGSIYQRQRTSIPAGDWKIPHLKIKACDFCEDVFGLSADVVFGDAWIPPFFSDPKGSNVVIVRSSLAQDIISVSNPDLYIQEISAPELIKSQGGSYTHRIKDISYRLRDEIDKSGWAPKKRIQPFNPNSQDSQRTKTKRERIQQLRVKIRDVSREAMLSIANKTGIATYNDKIKPLISALNKLY